MYRGLCEYSMNKDGDGLRRLFDGSYVLVKTVTCGIIYKTNNPYFLEKKRYSCEGMS